ncbi:MAG: FecR domain-containing protein [Alphaproteobacteria bacterium]
MRLAVFVAIALTAAAGGAMAAGIGVTSAVLPQATGQAPQAAPRVLEVGTDVVVDERIVTGEIGKTHLLFLDGSALTVGPNSDLVLDEFVYDPDARSGKIAMTASKGVLRFVGGRISKTTPVTIRTPTATIGIRGGIAILRIGATTTAKFLFGTELTVTAGGVTRRITRPGFQVIADGGEPGAPQPSDTGDLGGDVDDLEGTPQQTGSTRSLISENDVGLGQLGQLGSDLPPGQTGGTEPAGSAPRGDEPGSAQRVAEDDQRQRQMNDDNVDMGDMPAADDPGDEAPAVSDLTVDGGAGTQMVADNATLALFSTVTVSAANDVSVLVTFQSGTGGFTAASLAASGFVDQGGGSFLFNGTPARAQAALRALRFQPAANVLAGGNMSTTSISYSVGDGIVDLLLGTSIVVTGVNDAPVLNTLAAPTLAPVGSLTPFGGLTVTDADTPDMVTATVQIDNVAKGTFTAASVTAAGFTDQGGGSYSFTGTPAAAQAAIRLLAFEAADSRVTTGNSEVVNFNIAVNDGTASTSGAFSATVSCVDICRYDFTGRVKVGIDANVGTDDGTAASNRVLATTSTISGNRFKATTAQGTYELFLPTQAVAGGSTFTVGGANTPANIPGGTGTGTGFLAPGADFLYYHITGSQHVLFAGKPLAGFSFSDGTFSGAKYDLVADFGLGGSRVPFIPQSLIAGLAAPTSPTLTILLGSGNTGADRFFASAVVVVDGTGTAQKVGGSALVGLTNVDPSGSFHLSGSMRGTSGTGAAGNQPVRVTSPVASVDDGAGNDIFGRSNPRYLALESATVDASDVIQNRGGSRFRGNTMLADAVFANQIALNTATTFTPFTAATSGPDARDGGLLNGFAAGVSVDRDASAILDGVRGFLLVEPVSPSPLSDSGAINRDPTTNQISASFRVESQVSGGFSFSGDTQTFLTYGGISTADSGRSAFIDDSTFVALDRISTPTIVDNGPGSMPGFIVTNDFVTFANGAIPTGVTICTCAEIQWGLFNATLLSPSGQVFEIALGQWVAGERAISSQIVGLDGGTATYDGSVVATIANGLATNPTAVSRYTAFGSFSLDVDFTSGTTSLSSGTLMLDGTTYTLSPGAGGFGPGEYNFTITGPQRTGSGSGDLFGTGSPPGSTAGQFAITDGGGPPAFQAYGVYFGENTNFSPASMQ